MAAGIEARIYQGIEPSIKIAIEKVALHMLQRDVNIDFIKAITGLSVEKIRCLSNTKYSDQLVYGIIKAAPCHKEIDIKVEQAPEPIKTIQEGTKAGIAVAIEVGIDQVPGKWIEKGMEKASSYMLQRNVDINFISDITGLSLEQIEALDTVN